MNNSPDQGGSATVQVAGELAQLQQQTEVARLVLARLQQEVIAAEIQGAQAELLMAANEQLVLTTLHAQHHAETATQALQAAEINALSRASQSKTEFLSRVSHELRTPLNAILGFGQLMAMDDDDNDNLSSAQRERLEAIRMASQQLLALTNDMLDLARIEHGQVRIEMESIDVYKLVCASEILLTPTATALGVTMRNQLEAGRCMVMADERALGQVLLNLMSNAAKYNRSGGLVTVRAETLARGEDGREHIVIAIEDCGQGMTAAQLGDLFQPFNRVGAEAGVTPGHGLGLVISKLLVELMGGELQVHSEVGVGTTMQIQLQGPTPAISISENHAAQVPRIREASVTTARTVLYIEDSPVNVMLVQQMFVAEPAWRLWIATTGQQGVELAASQRPDLVLLDMHLPDMTGLDVMHLLQDRHLLPPKGCICLSADAMPAQIETALAAGFSQYWPKPLDVKLMMQRLRELLTANIDAGELRH